MRFIGTPGIGLSLLTPPPPPPMPRCCPCTGKSVPIVKGGEATRMEEGEFYAIETFGR